MWNLLIIPVALRPIVKYPIVDNLEDDGDSTFIKCAFWRRSRPEVFQSKFTGKNTHTEVRFQ